MRRGGILSAGPLWLSRFLMRSFACGRTLSAALAPALRSRQVIQPAALRSFAAVPTVKDKLVHVTFINRNGDRLRVPALEGQTLYEAALNHDVKVGDLFTCHVVLTPDSYEAHDRPLKEEIDLLETVHDRAPTSRLASFLKLSADVRETVVALTDARDTETP